MIECTVCRRKTDLIATAPVCEVRWCPTCGTVFVDDGVCVIPRMSALATANLKTLQDDLKKNLRESRS